MRREVDLSEISDGNLYGPNDMVKADCGDCKGCSACCHDMGDSIVLDPYDIYRLTTGLSLSFEALLNDKIELNVFDGMILPHLKMGGIESACNFLNPEGRCSVHAYRPSICRLFPLGRIYTDGSFQYFLQTHECRHENRTKVKVKKWIDTPDLKQNDGFILAWHDFVCEIQSKMMEAADDTLFKKVNMFLLQMFYMEPYHTEDFYTQFNERLAKAKQVVVSLMNAS